MGFSPDYECFMCYMIEEINTFVNNELKNLICFECFKCLIPYSDVFNYSYRIEELLSFVMHNSDNFKIKIRNYCFYCKENKELLFKIRDCGNHYNIIKCNNIK